MSEIHDERMCNAREVAEMFEVTEETVRDWIKSKKIRGFAKVEGAPYKIPLSDLKAFGQSRYRRQLGDPDAK